MIVDLQQQLSAAQAFTGAATVSTNVIDYGNVSPNRRVGDGEPIGVGVIVTVAAGAGSTHTMEVIQSTASNMSSPDIIASMTILAAVLVAGYKFFLPIPPGFPTKEFVAFRNTSTGGTTTVTLSAWATLQSAFQKDQVYAKGYVIS
jgi:hypothetical protein